MNQSDSIYIKKITLGQLATNCYILGCMKTKKAAVIDPAEENSIILEMLTQENFTLKYIINTHGHADHIGGNFFLKNNTSAKLLIHRMDEDMLTDPQKNLSFYTGHAIQSPPADDYLEEGKDIKIGSLNISVIHTPGHSPGSTSLLVGNKIFTGDTLFANGIGRTDLPGGSFSEIKQSIKDKLFILDSSCEIFPGHGPISDLGREISTNPWLQ
jgi:glyoxylase-like metal-dependent hydrolase (beta-lactamase superfamily II)